MIEMTFEFDDELEAFEMLTFARSRNISVALVKKDGIATPIQDGGFLKEKPAARRLPEGANVVREPKITKKHVIK